MADIKKLAEELTKLTVLEVNELKNHLKDEYGIEPAAAAVAVAGPATGGDAGAAAADEKTALSRRDAITKKWSDQYPNAMNLWIENWDVITPIFKFSKDVSW